MKKLLLILPVVLLITFSGKTYASDAPKFDDDATKLNLWIPGFLVKMVAEIAEDHVEGEEAAAIDLMRKFGGITISIREGEYYCDKSDKKMTRKLNRMEKRNFEDLVSVKSEDANVNLSIRENNRGKIKRLVVLVDEPGETFVYVKMHCRLSVEDITKLTGQFASN